MRSRFDTQTRGAVLQALRGGLTLNESAARAGLPVKTLKNWLTRGRAEVGTEHADFAAAVDQARDAAAMAPLSVGEFRGCVAAAVRRGSVQAMRLWWSLREEREPYEPMNGALDALDGKSVIERVARLRAFTELDSYDNDEEHHDER